jgi:hypothetical protein
MNASRTRQIVLMPPPQVHAGAFDYQDFVSAAKAHGPGRAPQNHPLTREGDLKPEWLALLSDFSDRFLIGTDQFFLDPQVMRGPAAAFAQKTGMNRKRTLRFLSLLPGDLAKKIAFENAKRVYKLPD